MAKYLSTLFAAVLTSALVCPSTTCATPAVLRSVAEVDDFIASGTNYSCGITFKASFQYETIAGKNKTMFIMDTQGRRAIVSLNAPMITASVGDEATLFGVAYNFARHDPLICITNLILTGKAPIEVPKMLSPGQIDRDRDHMMPIITEGSVSDIRDDEVDKLFKVLTLEDNGSSLQAFVPTRILTNSVVLIGARIRVTGRYFRELHCSRKFQGPILLIDEMTVIEPATKSPYDASPLTIRPYQDPGDLSRAGRRTVRGNVMAAWGGNSLLLQSEGNRIVCVELSDPDTLPPYGALVTASGFPDTDSYHLFLSRAVCRLEKSTDYKDESPSAARLKDLMSFENTRRLLQTENHGRLLSLTGVLKGIHLSEGPEKHALIDCEGAYLRVDFSSTPQAFQAIAIGSTVEVTGRCIVQVKNKTIFNRYPKLDGLLFVPRTVADIRVISGPPWWTPARLLILIGILVAGIAALMIRNRILRQMTGLKIAERTRLAIELHDSLSQALAGLACQIAAVQDSVKSNPTSLVDKLETTTRMLASCRTELQQCLFDLGNDTLNDADFVRAIWNTIQHLSPYANVTVRFNVTRSRFNDSIAHATLAIIRELVANAIRHGGADNIRIAGTIDKGKLRFSVTDNGYGFDISNCAGIADGHFGLNGIRERTKQLGGRFDLISRPGKGTRASATLPLTSQT